jgi:hypothetical protein
MLVGIELERGSVDMYLHIDCLKGKFTIRLRLWKLKLTVEVPP